VCGGLGLLDEQGVGDQVLPPIAAALDIAKAFAPETARRFAVCSTAVMLGNPTENTPRGRAETTQRPERRADRWRAPAFRIVEPPLEIAHSSGQTGGHKAAAAAASLIPKSLFRMVFVRTA